MTMANNHWTPPAPLHPIPNQPERYTKSRDNHIAECVGWRKRHDRSKKFPFTLSPGKSTDPVHIEQSRLQLLIEADEIAKLIAQRCGDRYAIAMADSVRDCLAVNNVEEFTFLELWHTPIA